MPSSYKNFRAAVYCTVQDVIRMQDEQWRESGLAQMGRSLKIDKVYLETFRSMVVADAAAIQNAKEFFAGRGISTAGGITTSWMATPDWEFKSLCYCNPEHREILTAISVATAKLFDEMVLDDFFFTSCTCERCIAAKGKRNWTEYRLSVMEDAAEKLVITPAKKANPAVRIVLKFPNWYEHYHFLGYNLDAGKKLFDGIYTGAETRDAEYTSQHLPPYLSYGIMRYLDNVFPGKNSGGWVDPFVRRDLDRYAEQIRLTLFAKAKEITLFSFGALADWSTEFDASPTPKNWVTPVAGNTLDDCDAFLAELGEPYGLESYKPMNSSGEDYLHGFLGTFGVPIEMQPQLTSAAKTILLTECVKFDDQIVAKISGLLLKGASVIITSGLLKALQDKGLKEITAVECSDKNALVNTFTTFTDVFRSAEDILIPQIVYHTNDAIEMITCLKNENGYPLLLRVPYAKGSLYVLTIPDTLSDLYRFPREILAHLKRIVMRDLPLHVESDGMVSLFLYRNNTCIVESFLPHISTAEVVFHRDGALLQDLKSGVALPGYNRDGATRFPLTLYPHTYRVFRFE
jgi:hypothetical protein